ncbi:MAG: PAS domain S-box protein [Candidatus Deferrimicrobiaceae bacterium]
MTTPLFETDSEFLTLLVDSITEKIVVLDPREYRILYANRSFRDSHGVAGESLIGKRCYEVTHRESQPCHITETECPMVNVLATGNPSTVTHVHQTADGTREYIRLTAYPILDRDGTITRVIETSRNVTELTLLQESFRLKSEQFEKILSTCPDGIIANDPRGNIFLFNPGAERIFGYRQEEVFGKLHVSRVYPPGEARKIKEHIYSDQYGGRGRLVDFETTVVSREGQRIPIRLSCALLHDRETEVGTVGFFQDISARQEILRNIRESEARFRGIIETARDGILTVGEERRIRMANRAAEELLGYGHGEMTGMDIHRLFPPAYLENWGQIVRYALTDTERPEEKTVEITALKKNGDPLPLHISLSKSRTTEETPVLTAILRDISAWKLHEEELRLLSITDPLTRLYNRRHFQSIAQQEIERSARNKVPFSILMVDIDHFKSYNDRFGHAEGDALLQTLAELIRGSFRSMDTGFRFGGEEFVVFLPETDSSSAMIAAERLRGRLSGHTFVPVPGEAPVTVTASIGIAAYQEGVGLDEIVRRADLAMYAAKNRGRDRCEGYHRLSEGAPTRPHPP